MEYKQKVEASNRNDKVLFFIENVIETITSSFAFEVEELSQFARVFMTCCGSLMTTIALYTSVSLLTHRIKSATAIKAEHHLSVRRMRSKEISCHLFNF